MNIYSFARTAAVAALLVCLLGVGVAPAVAQDGNSTVPTPPNGTNLTATSTATSTPLGEARAEPNIDLSNTITLKKWRFESGVWHITLRSRTVGSVTVTDGSELARALTEGSGQATGTASFRRYDLEPASTTTISFDGSKFQGASAVSVAPNADSGRIAVLRTEAFGAEETLVKQSTAALLVAVSAVGAGWGTYRRLKDRLADETKAAERHL